MELLGIIYDQNLQQWNCITKNKIGRTYTYIKASFIKDDGTLFVNYFQQ